MLRENGDEDLLVLVPNQTVSRSRPRRLQDRNGGGAAYQEAVI